MLLQIEREKNKHTHKTEDSILKKNKSHLWFQKRKKRDRETERQRERETEKQRNRETERQTNRQTVRQTDR